MQEMNWYQWIILSETLKEITGHFQIGMPLIEQSVATIYHK